MKRTAVNDVKTMACLAWRTTGWRRLNAPKSVRPAINARTIERRSNAISIWQAARTSRLDAIASVVCPPQNVELAPVQAIQRAGAASAEGGANRRRAKCI